MLRLWRQYVDDRSRRRDFPLLYDDAYQTKKLAAFAQRYRGKVVAVVGNAQSIFHFESGAEIDGADVVIRMNEGAPRSPASQGTRTDVLCLATRTSPEVITTMFGEPAIIFVTPRRAVLSPELASDAAVVALPVDDWRKISSLINRFRPSAGLMATWLARQVFESPDVRLYGFDWKKTKTFYAEKKLRKHHNWMLERDLMLKWATEGWLRLPPGTN
jgi:hypothetical protein